MSAKQFTLTPTTVAFLIFLICAAAIHFGGTTLKQTVLSQPPYQVLQRDPPPLLNQIKTGAIHIIREQSASSQQPMQSTLALTPTSDIPNNLFGGKGQNSITQSATNDYFALLSSSGHLRLDAITHNGAIINGTFILIGSPIASAAYPAPGEDATSPSTLNAPRLTAITATTVMITEPTLPYRTIKLSLD